MQDRLLTSPETAQMLGLAENSLRWHRCHGSSPVPFVKLGRRVLYRLSDVQAYIASLQPQTCTTEVRG